MASAWDINCSRRVCKAASSSSGLAVQCIPLQHYAVRGGHAVAYGRELPVEGRVECESVPSHLINHVQISLSFSARMRALAPGQLDTVRGLYRTAYPLAEDALTGAKGKRTTQMLPLARNHVFDGITFLAEVAISAHDTRVNGFGISNALKTQLTDAAA